MSGSWGLGGALFYDAGGAGGVAGQGGRGRGANAATFGPDGDQTSDQGVWMSVWVEDVDAVHAECVAAGLDITFPPTDMPWGVRETHLRHPDGHVFRISRSTS